jgi:hypothetical protein
MGVCSMIKIEEMDLFEPVYSFVDRAGEGTHIASARLTAHVSTNSDKHEIFHVPVDEQLAQRFIDERSVSLHWCHLLMEHMLANSDQDRVKVAPIIFAETCDHEGVSHLLVDGHHRYVLFAIAKLPLIPAIILPEHVWRMFEIIGHPSISREELRAMPIVKVIEG